MKIKAFGKEVDVSTLPSGGWGYDPSQYKDLKCPQGHMGLSPHGPPNQFHEGVYKCFKCNRPYGQQYRESDCVSSQRRRTT